MSFLVWARMCISTYSRLFGGMLGGSGGVLSTGRLIIKMTWLVIWPS